MVEAALDGKYNGHPTRLEYLARPDGSVALVYAAQIENVEDNKWFEAFIDAQSGELLSVVDFTADVTVSGRLSLEPHLQSNKDDS